jgi:hypothetical protein
LRGKPDDQPTKIPNLYVVAVNEPGRLVGRFIIVDALDDLWRPGNVVLAVDKIDSIYGHGALPSSGGSTTELSAADA